jgi:hypothetical protein
MIDPRYTAQKIAFLLDFDGPFFVSDLVEEETIQFFGITKAQWDEVYGMYRSGTFVDVGAVLSHFSKQTNHNEKEVWNHLGGELTKDLYCPDNNKEALGEFLKMGHVELITQGHAAFQHLKLDASGVLEMIDMENRKTKSPFKHSVRVVESDKSILLRARLKGLWEDGYQVIQIDDRVEPLYDLQQFADQQGIGRNMFQQYRVRAGKYGKVENPEGYEWKDFFSTGEVVKCVKDPYRRPTIEGRYHLSARMNR